MSTLPSSLLLVGVEGGWRKEKDVGGNRPLLSLEAEAGAGGWGVVKGLSGIVAGWARLCEFVRMVDGGYPAEVRLVRAGKCVS